MKQYRPGDLIGGELTVQRVFGGEGKSGMGVVYLVSAHDAPGPFVLKTVQPRWRDPGGIALFAKEAQAWVSIGWHPNIVKAFWVREIEEVLHIAAEYVPPDEEGRNTLTHYLEIVPDSPSLILRWIAQFSYAMARAQSKGLRAHRDIKPDNLMIDRQGNLKVTDFGLSILLDGVLSESFQYQDSGHGSPDMTIAESVRGTLPYMAPEQFLDAKKVDCRADIYAFGIILFQMVTGGHYPFLLPRAKRDVLRAYAKMHHTAIAPALKSPFDSVVARCLAKKAAERYQSFEELIAGATRIAHQLGLRFPPRPNTADDEIEELFMHAQSFSALGQSERAMEAVSRYLSHRPNAFWGWTEKGRLHLEKGQTEEAVSAARKSLDLYAENSHAWNNLGLALHRLGRHENALEAFDSAITMEPRNTGAMMNMVQPLLSLRRYAEASLLLQKALDLAPTKTTLLFNASNVAAFMLQAQQVSTAMPVLRLLTKYDPSNAQNWHNLALAYQAEGNREEAIVCFTAAEEISPEDAFCLMSLTRLHAEAGHFSLALSYCDKLIARDAELVKALSFKAQVLNHLGRAQEAISLLTSALRQHPESDPLWFILSDLRLSNGDHAGALDALRECKSALQSLGTKLNRENLQMVEQRIHQLEKR